MAGLGSACIAMDVNPQQFKMPIDEGRSSLKTPCGTIFGILTVLVVLAFTAQKIIVLHSKSDISIIATDLVDHFGT